MTNQGIQQIKSNSIEFCARLRSGQLGDFTNYMTPDLEGIGVNGQALCVQLASNLEADGRFIPEVSDYIEAWIACYESGLLVEIPRNTPPAGSAGQPSKSAAEIEADRLAREIVREQELMRKQRRPQQEPPKPENEVFNQLKQAELDEETIRAVKSDCNNAQMKVALKFGVQDHGETNRLRTVELLRLKGEYVKKFPLLTERIEQEVNAAAAGMGLQLQTTSTQRLPLDCSNDVRRNATVEQLKDLRRREQERDRKAAQAREE